ncbi:hypothetical protein KP509_15G037700 [Ceratopteris richardii]|uniref:Uncharacterized protein n=1 Tax=Ceratopteris richardii TaxID=49495 RepID=A0A8T2T484_CERRI|nr:hypothetical protein KP509_15G037700 [Ceratopteris richardii]
METQQLQFISIATLAWSLLVLAFGVACKEISIGHTNATLVNYYPFLLGFSIPQSINYRQ